MKRERLTQDWNLMYEALLEYKTKHGDTIVPLKWDDDPALGEWVQNQRQLKARMRLLGERVKALDDVDFVWDITCTDEWRYEELRRYKEQYGHTLVPTAWAENPSLAEWVQTRRALRRKGKISDGHERWLNKLDFTWDATFRSGPRLKWHQRYEQLQAFKRRYGHCLVPQNWPENKQLGHWVCQQRANLSTGKLSKEHLRLLNAMQFVWNASAGSEAARAAKGKKGGGKKKGGGGAQEAAASADASAEDGESGGGSEEVHGSGVADSPDGSPTSTLEPGGVSPPPLPLLDGGEAVPLLPEPLPGQAEAVAATSPSPATSLTQCGSTPPARRESSSQQPQGPPAPPAAAAPAVADGPSPASSLQTGAGHPPAPLQLPPAALAPSAAGPARGAASPPRSSASDDDDEAAEEGGGRHGHGGSGSATPSDVSWEDHARMRRDRARGGHCRGPSHHPHLHHRKAAVGAAAGAGKACPDNSDDNTAESDGDLWDVQSEKSECAM